MKKINKSGAMMPKTILTLVLLLFGFAIILIVYTTLNAENQIDKAVCHDSIVLRSTFNAGPFELGKESIPLKCKTEKICLSMSGDDCPGMTPSKKNPVTEVELAEDSGDAKREILDTIANAMYDCNSMLGEGRLDFMPHEFKEEKYCLICSRLALDKEARKEVNEISYEELYKYLEKKKTPSGKGYLNYIYPAWLSWEDSKEFFDNMKKESDNEDFKKLKFEDWKINLEFENGYAVIAMMAPKGTWQKWAKIAVVGTVSLVFLPATIAGTVVLASGGALYIYNHPNDKYEWLPPTIFSYDADTLKNLECSSFETAS